MHNPVLTKKLNAYKMPVGVLIGDRSQLSAVQLRLHGLLCTL